jgi:signal transduction histidine kinase
MKIKNFQLSDKLRIHLLPLVVLLFLTVTFSAPLIFLLLGLEDQRQQAAELSQRMALLIQTEGNEHALFWKYNTPKLLMHLRTIRNQANVQRIEVTDESGQTLETQALKESQPLDRAEFLWESAPIQMGPKEVGRVWVALSTASTYRQTLLLLFLFCGLGISLAVLLFTIPIRTVQRAEGRIESLVQELEQTGRALAQLNQNLEQQVIDRSCELKKAFDDLSRNQKQLQQIASRAAALSEQERRRIGRDLHDGVGQALTAARLQIQLMAEGKPTETVFATLLPRTLAVLDEALEETRRAVEHLGPAVLDGIDFASALQRYVCTFTERTGLPVQVEVNRLPENVPSFLESACYRIVQEALTNVAKHAFPNREKAVSLEESAPVQLVVGGESNRVKIEVRDTGCGFDTQSVRDLSGHGLVGVRERVAMLGGTFSLKSSPGQGTVLCVDMPIDPACGGNP